MTASAAPASPGLPPAAAPSAPAASAALPRDRRISDRGAVRRGSVRAERWNARGVVKVTGEVDVDDARIVGSLSVGGRCRAGALTVDGLVEVGGPAVLERRSALKGIARFAGDLTAAALTVHGPIVVDGTLRVPEYLHLLGELRAGGDATIGNLTGSGSARVRGTLTAGTIDLEVLEASSLGPVRARVVRVRRRPTLPFRLPFFGRDPPKLDALRIEAEEVALEGVTAEFLRAPRIVLGPDCHIARVEGTVERLHPTSHVGPESRSPTPYGIRR